jgi:hypothetical protein
VTLRFWGLLKAAFSFKPPGMIVAPNWVGVALFAMLGILNPGLWLIGAGLELAYLLSLVTNERFRRLVERDLRAAAIDDRGARVEARVRALSATAQRRFRQLEERCEAVLSADRPDDHAETIEHREEALGRLLDVYLQLLAARDTAARVLAEADRSIPARLSEVRTRLAHGDGLAEDLKRSLEAQEELLRGRVESQQRAQERIEYIDSELARVEQQVELLREQAILDAESTQMTSRIDALADTLQDTRGWLTEQRKLAGLGEEASEPVPLRRRRAAAQRQKTQ